MRLRSAARNIRRGETPGGQECGRPERMALRRRRPASRSSISTTAPIIAPATAPLTAWPRITPRIPTAATTRIRVASRSTLPPFIPRPALIRRCYADSAHPVNVWRSLRTRSGLAEVSVHPYAMHPRATTNPTAPPLTTPAPTFSAIPAAPLPEPAQITSFAVSPPVCTLR
jgi:hypothetical protein